MHSLSRFTPLLIAAAAVALPRSSPASLIVALDLETMVARANNVAVVDGMSVTAAWDERHEQILSTITLAVVESWKGPAAPATRLEKLPAAVLWDMDGTLLDSEPYWIAEEHALV